MTSVVDEDVCIRGCHKPKCTASWDREESDRRSAQRHTTDPYPYPDPTYTPTSPHHPAPSNGHQRDVDRVAGLRGEGGNGVGEENTGVSDVVEGGVGSGGTWANQSDRSPSWLASEGRCGEGCEERWVFEVRRRLIGFGGRGVWSPPDMNCGALIASMVIIRCPVSPAVDGAYEKKTSQLTKGIKDRKQIKTVIPITMSWLLMSRELAMTHLGIGY